MFLSVRRNDSGGVLSEESKKRVERAGEAGPPGAPSLLKEGRVCNFLEFVTVSDWIELKKESGQGLAPGPSPPPALGQNDTTLRGLGAGAREREPL